MRLNKFLSQNGICSRRDAEKLIEDGRVTINGTIVIPPAPLLKGDEIITVDGKKINNQETEKVWTFYKPQGLVTTHKDEQNRHTVFDFLKENGLKERVISVGRLDLNSEGLLLVTNSTKFAAYAESPKTGWKRIYHVRVFGDIRNLDLAGISKGLTIDGINYKGIICEIENDSKKSGKNTWLRLTLTEGKNREIRKIMEYFELSVNRLIRISYGPYSLEKLRPGEFKEVDSAAILKNI
jgi:23S rRNA pseudouridine2605 synthase